MPCRRLSGMFVLACLAAPLPAAGHVVFSQGEATAGGYYVGFLRVTHGCGDAATVSVHVTVPESVVSARPQPKPGWALRIYKVALAKPITGEGGAQIATRVTTITWTGTLPADQFDEFGLSLKLPAQSGPLYFPTVQRCTTGENDWTTIPPSPEHWHHVDRPAPMLILRAEGAEMPMAH